ncbi:hypothetical protein FEP83_05972 [Burkholderia multivorans]|nr:hypothetical protein [Burkholderia multivorans]
MSVTMTAVVPYVPAPGVFFAAIAFAIAVASPPSTTSEIEWDGMPFASVALVSFS